MSAPLLEEIVEAGVEHALGKLYTAQPGLVTSFDKDTHSVHVQPVFSRLVLDEDGSKKLVKQPVIPNVPVWFLGSGDARMTFPIAKGSTVLLVHLSGDRPAWQFTKGDTTIGTTDERRGTLTDCVAIPGGLTASVASRLATGSARVDDNGVIIHTPGKIYLGGGSTEPVARKPDLTNIKNCLKDSGVLAAIAAYTIATIASSGIPAALANVQAQVEFFFGTNPIDGSDVTESE